MSLSARLHRELEETARAALGNEFRIDTIRPVNGGDINTALRLDGPTGPVFVKLRDAEDATMFSAEAQGLDALATYDAIRVPAVLGQGEADGQAFLLLEWLDISPLREAHHARRAGEALAALHRQSGEHFGWPRANFIGGTPQNNSLSDNWPHFFVQQRLVPQLALAASKGFGGELQRHGERLCGKVAALFLEYRPQASLLHGDLWSGNIGALADGTPVLFDPACYFGDRDTDLALSELFGGPPLDFYSAYRASWPLAEGYEQRKTLYNLYHVLNHLNLFGGGYLRQAERMAAQLANELGR